MLKYTLFGFLMISFFSYEQEPQIQFKSVKIEKDYVQYGAIGIRFSGRFDMLEFRKKYPSDSLMSRAFLKKTFTFSIKPHMNGASILSNKGYDRLFSKKEVVYQIPYTFSQKDVDSLEFEFSQFLPYAAMNLNSGEQHIGCTIMFSGKDGFNHAVIGRFELETLTFQKPKTRLFEIVLDSLEINPVNEKGKRWDPSITNRDLADMEFSLSCGGIRVLEIYKENSNHIRYRKNPLIFALTISENDEIHISLVDRDLFFHDAIAYWKLDSMEMPPDEKFEFSDGKVNMVAYHFSCKAGPLIE